MYYTHNLRTNLQEWKNRLYRSPYEQFGHQIKYFSNNLEGEKIINSLLKEACQKYPFDADKIEEYVERSERNGEISFDSEIEHAAYCYQKLKYLGQKYGYAKIQNLMIYTGHGFEETRGNVVEQLVTPIVYFLHDRIEKSSSTIFLLEKYKKRIEWFTKEQLLAEYKNSIKNYEKIFEDDLRLFLFEQGIDYPFSTPKSSSGRADIVGAIDTSDPLIIEVKILDKEKNYGKNRIKDGFNQIIKYTNDFNKNFGYLILFNVDNIEIDFKFSDSKKTFPPMLTFGDRTYYFIVINLFFGESASKQGQLESMEISEDDLVR
jgi:hypothetical protein